ncbi:MAG: hypothetical protein QM692_17030 [Thermomicrobiales bacterium]
MRNPRYLLAACGLSLSLLTPLAVAAQDATPAATPAGRTIACTTEPRDIDALVALWFDESGAPREAPAMAEPVQDEAALPDGKKPDEADLAAITKTTEQWVYCIEIAGQYARGFNVLTDDLAGMLGPDTTDPALDSPDEIRALLESQLATPVTSEADTLPTQGLNGPRKPRQLADGRIGAIWVVGGSRLFLMYEKVDDQWLVDEVVPLATSSGTPTAESTPAA